MENIPTSQLVKLIDELLVDIRKPEIYKDNMVLYNDLLILKITVLNIPQSYNEVLSNELNAIKQQLGKGKKGGLFGIGDYIWGKGPVTLDKVTSHLKTVEKKGVVMEDFIICSEKKKRQLK